ncbi:hypothetical protein [Ramlibacter sp. AN1133]|uniref:hypothetical protein n=1 Tax=Ramlibacter sp. AN1133 TaxID=3133429 RepID=UPI0030BC5721
MKRAVRLALLALAIVAVYGLGKTAWLAQELRASTAFSVREGIQVDRRLEAHEFAALGLTLPDFAVTDNGAFVLSTGAAIYEFGTNGAEEHRVEGPSLSSFTVDADGTVLTIAGGFLGRLDAEHRPVQAIPMPFAEARLAPGVTPGTALLYGRDTESSRLYRVHSDGRFEVLLETAKPIVAVAESRAAVYVATSVALLRMDGNEAPSALTLDESPVLSIAVLADDAMAFVATRNSVLVWRGGAMRSLVNGSGGMLRTRDGSLYVLDQPRGMAYVLRVRSS